jgi:hypothetical protein
MVAKGMHQTALSQEETMSINGTPSTSEQNLNIVELTRSLIRYGIRHLYQILIVGLVCFVVSLGLYMQADEIYKSQLTAETYHLQAGRVVEMVKALDKLLYDKNYEKVAHDLNIPLASVKKLDEIEVTTIVGDKGREEEAKIFTLTAWVTDLAVLDTLDYGISHYLSEVPYAKQRMALRHQELKSQISRIETEMAELDSAKGLSLEDLDMAGQGVSFNLKAPSNLSLELVELYRRKLALEKQLELAKEVSIIQNFTKFQTPVAPRKIVYFSIGLVVSLLVLGILAFFQAVFSEPFSDDTPAPSRQVEHAQAAQNPTFAGGEKSR